MENTEPNPPQCTNKTHTCIPYKTLASGPKRKLALTLNNCSGIGHGHSVCYIPEAVLGTKAADAWVLTSYLKMCHSVSPPINVGVAEATPSTKNVSLVLWQIWIQYQNVLYWRWKREGSPSAKDSSGSPRHEEPVLHTGSSGNLKAAAQWVQHPNGGNSESIVFCEHM